MSDFNDLKPQLIQRKQPVRPARVLQLPGKIDVPKIEEAEKRAKRWFDESVKKHEMIVLKDDGLYRHLRFKSPGTHVWYWDLVTWPRHLYIGGDIGGGLTFSRIDDMFNFFTTYPTSPINPGYWSEKLTAHNIQTKKFSEEHFVAAVTHYFNDRMENLEESAYIWDRIESDVLSCRHDEHEAMQAVYDFNVDDFMFEDFEFDFQAKDWDVHFLYACFAIVFGIRMYKESKK